MNDAEYLATRLVPRLRTSWVTFRQSSVPCSEKQTLLEICHQKPQKILSDTIELWHTQTPTLKRRTYLMPKLNTHDKSKAIQLTGILTCSNESQIERSGLTPGILAEDSTGQTWQPITMIYKFNSWWGDLFICMVAKYLNNHHHQYIYSDHLCIHV